MGAADNLTKREAAIAAFASEQATRIYSLLRHLPPRSRRPPLPPARLRPAGYTVDTATEISLSLFRTLRLPPGRGRLPSESR